MSKLSNKSIRPLMETIQTASSNNYSQSAHTVRQWIRHKDTEIKNVLVPTNLRQLQSKFHTFVDNLHNFLTTAKKKNLCKHMKGILGKGTFSPQVKEKVLQNLPQAVNNIKCYTLEICWNLQILHKGTRRQPSVLASEGNCQCRGNQLPEQILVVTTQRVRSQQVESEVSINCTF